MRRFNTKVFIVSTAILSFMAYYSFSFAFHGMSALNHNFFTDVVDTAALVFEFPVVTFLRPFKIEVGITEYLGLLFLNCLFYGMLVERLLSLRMKRTK